MRRDGRLLQKTVNLCYTTALRLKLFLPHLSRQSWVLLVPKIFH